MCGVVPRSLVCPLEDAHELQVETGVRNGQAAVASGLAVVHTPFDLGGGRGGGSGGGGRDRGGGDNADGVEQDDVSQQPPQEDVSQGAAAQPFSATPEVHKKGAVLGHCATAHELAEQVEQLAEEPTANLFGTQLEQASCRVARALT